MPVTYTFKIATAQEQMRLTHHTFKVAIWRSKLLQWEVAGCPRSRGRELRAWLRSAAHLFPESRRRSRRGRLGKKAAIALHRYFASCCKHRKSKKSRGCVILSLSTFPYPPPCPFFPVGDRKKSFKTLIS